MLYNEEIELDEDFEGVDDSEAEVVTEFDEIDENTDYDNNYTYADIDFSQDTPQLINTPTPVVDPVVEETELIPDTEYETVTETYEIRIQDYSQEYLQSLEDDGYTFYVIYEDGTEDEVDISEIEEPTTSIEFLDDEAYVLANSILEHFWDDDSGVHVTQDTKESWAQLVEDNFPDLDATHPHHNIIVNSYGVLIRSALKNLVQLSRSALAFYDGLGNNSSNIISTFGRGGIQIGPTDQKHLIINNNGITVYNGDGTVAPLTASNIQAIEANIQTLTAADVSITNRLTAAEAVIDDLDVNYAHISNGVIDNAKIGYADVNGLSANYAQVNMANVNNAWIQNGTVKDGAITNAMINSVSANKLTAGTIDASNITVTNLNADNITAGTLNGQRIGSGSLSLDKLEEDVYTETEVDGIVQNLQTQIDGAIETWTGTTIPTLQNAPAVDWNTNSIKDTHVGDVYFVVNSQSQQNGYNYRFTKIDNTYSWQLIKDNDVTNALQRLTTAEGKITQFTSDISQLQTDTGTLTTKTTSLETRMSDAEDDILDKVDTTTFKAVSDTVDQHTQTITQHTTAISNKADNSTVTAVTSRVSKNEQDISGLTTSVGQLQTTVETKADSSDVTTISNKLNTVSDTVDGHTQSITSLNTTIVTEAAKVQSRGIQLVTNGNGFMGNNTNWSTLTFDGTKTNTSPGSFTHTVENTIIMSDECFPIDVSKDYLFEFDAMSIDGSARFHSFLAMCDADKNIINAQPVMYYVNTLTTLANDLNPGDTTVRLTSATNWVSTTDGHQRSLIFWDYTNSFGYTYPEESYSRNYYADIYANDNAVDKSTGVITLKTPWSGPKKLAGTKVSQNHSGNTYVYAQANTLAPTEWTHFSFVYSGLDLVNDGSDSSGKFRQGTAFAKVGFLWNYGHSTANPQTQMWTTNISVKEYVATGSAVTALTTRVTNAESSIAQNAEAIALRATKTEATQMAQPNLSPYFSSSPYNKAANSYWYGMGTNSNYIFTDMSDGWMRVQCTNSGSSVIRVDWYPIKCSSVIAGQPYTWLVEVRNNASTNVSSGSDFYLVQSNNCQFWGQKAIKTISGPSNAGMSVNIGTCGSSYVLQKVQNAETASDGHWTNNDAASVVGLACWTFRCAANSTIDYEIRLSIYEGEYAGPYKPYVGSQLYASQSELKIANDAISTKVEKDGVISSINQSAEIVKIQASKVEIDGAAIFSNTAFRQAADSAYDAKGSAQTVQNNLDNLEIGGRNLLLGTGTPRTTSALTPTASNYAIADFYELYVPYNQIVEADDLITVSFDWSCTATGGNWHLECGKISPYTWGTVVKSIGTRNATSNYVDVSSSNNSGRVEITFKATSSHASAEDTLKWLRIRMDGTDWAGKTFSISNAKAERGNKATDWTPAPEDQTAYVDSIQIGGRNLLPNSQDWSGAAKRTNGTIVVTSDTYGGCSVLTHVWGSRNSDVGYQDNVWTQPIEADAWYTLSFWAKASSDVETYSYFYSTNAVDEGFNSSGKRTTQDDGAIKNSITTEWQRIWVSWHIKAGATAFPAHLIVTRLQSTHSGITLYISGPKLEKGNKATDWTPAPEDQTAYVDSIQIGGRNLLRGTGSYASWDPSSSSVTPNLTTTDEWIKLTTPENKSWWTVEPHDAFIPIEDWDVSSKYILSVDIKYDNRKANAPFPRIGIETVTNKNAGYGSRVNELTITGINPTTNNWTHFERTFDGDYSKWTSVNSGTPAYVKVVVWLYIDSSEADAVYIRRLKLEKGNRATDWTPAPEDVDSAILADGVEYIAGTQTSATGSWIGVTRDSSLVAGKTIAYKLPYAGSGNASLQLKDSSGNNVGGNIAVYSMTTRVTTHYPAGSIIQMTYDGTYWRTAGWYNTNNYDRILHNNYILAAEAVASGALTCATSAGYKQIKASQTFDMSYPILWASGAWTAGNQYANAYEAYPSINPATTGTVQNIVKNATVYLKGTISGNVFTCASSNFLTCTVPTSADNFFYIPLGVVANDATTKIYFSTSRDLYAFIDGKFRQVTPTEIVLTHRIYYRSASATKPSAPSSWIAEATGNVYNQWTTKVPPLAANTTAGQTKYLYLYTCEQRQRLDGTLNCTTVQLDENTTVIDGGQIITNSVTADQIAAGAITTDKLDASAVTAGKIASGAITADKLNASNINASNSLTIGAFSTSTQDDILNTNTVVGGRNLLLNSANRTKWQVNAPTSYGIGTIRFSENLVKGEQYTLQVWGTVERSDKDNNAIFNAFWGGGNVALGAMIPNTERNYWTLTFTAPNTTHATTANAWLNLYNTVPVGASGTTYSSNVLKTKLERGNRPTDWTPAPEDVDADIASAATRTDVSIAVTAIDYAAETATLQASLYIDGVVTTSGVTYQWLKDGTNISGQTSRTLSVTSAMGLSHVYSCTATY